MDMATAVQPFFSLTDFSRNGSVIALVFLPFLLNVDV